MGILKYKYLDTWSHRVWGDKRWYQNLTRVTYISFQWEPCFSKVWMWMTVCNLLSLHIFLRTAWIMHVHIIMIEIFMEATRLPVWLFISWAQTSRWDVNGLTYDSSFSAIWQTCFASPRDFYQLEDMKVLLSISFNTSSAALRCRQMFVQEIWCTSACFLDHLSTSTKQLHFF